MKIKEFRGALCQLLFECSSCAELEADELLRRFGEISRGDILLGEKELSAKTCALIREAAGKRLAGHPLQYLLGEWDFYGRTFFVGEGVLIPRADTETLVEAGLAFARDKGDSVIADLCAGSGCIGITMALELPKAAVYAVEKSGEALFYLRENAAVLGASLQIRRDDVLGPTENYPEFDLILSNPPYLTDADMDTLQAEVRREPEMALRGGTDGLLFYRGITSQWPSRLKPGGMLAFEVGMGQAEAVGKIMENKRFKNICFHQDLCGIIRVVTGTISDDC